MPKKINARIATVKVLLRLLKQQGSLASELVILNDVDEKERRLAQELCYGVCRWYFFLEDTLNTFVAKPLKEKDRDIKLLMLLGIYQLQFTRVAPHAAINETVNAVVFFRKQWAKKLINGVLRSFQRSQEQATVIAPNAKQSHPQWMQNMIGQSWSEHAAAIFLANNEYPPFSLRLHCQKISVDKYLTTISEQGGDDVSVAKTPYSDVGITLNKAVDVTSLAGFTDGIVSVQDEAAQLAAPLLQLKPQQRVLDACCAPGGKTCHIGEMQPDLAALVAVDLDARRLVRVEENLARQQIAAKVIRGDATQPSSWWGGAAI